MQLALQPVSGILPQDSGAAYYRNGGGSIGSVYLLYFLKRQAVDGQQAGTVIVCR